MGRSWNVLKNSLKMRRPSDENDSLLLVDNARAELEVPKKHFVVRVGANSKQYVVPQSYTSIPSFRALMDKSSEEYGSESQMPLQLSCEEEAFEELLMNLKQPQKCRLWML
ncbi:SAUR-like auxin-responsive protein [Carex littledalei]|uniref:SAUR-like auxin-responsive protein n=1 Tax=Carex littledalei TaxID=544730 RepID=A0A833QM45_9POAL|nr:SAUR-like auxin-responsive protein [Carex littledalei]